MKKQVKLFLVMIGVAILFSHCKKEEKKIEFNAHFCANINTSADLSLFVNWENKGALTNKRTRINFASEPGLDQQFSTGKYHIEVRDNDNNILSVLEIKIEKNKISHHSLKGDATLIKSGKSVAIQML